jgi:hypothetical protein
MDVKSLSHRYVILAGLVLLMLFMFSCISGNQKDTIDLPNNVTAEADANGNVTVKWESVLMKRDLVEYVVYWNTDSQFDEKNTSSAEVSANAYFFMIPHLHSGKWYVGVKGKFLRTYSGINTTQEIQLGPLSDTVEIQIP